MINSAAMKILLLLLATLFHAGMATAGGVYQEPEAFIAEVFAEGTPEQRVTWPDESLRQQMEAILGHPYRGMRIRYWIAGNKTAWVLEEIGKEKPITTGIVVENGHIERVRVLIFRESRGWEVRHAFFTQQFENVRLDSETNLDRSIDNISGATLSVRAVTKLARIALLLHQEVLSNG